MENPPLMPSSKKNLSSNERNLVAQYLHSKYSNGNLAKGAISAMAAKYGISKQSVRSIWRKALAQMAQGMHIQLFNQKKCLRQKRRHLDTEKLKKASLSERGTVRGLGEILGVSSTTAWKWVKAGQIRIHSNAIKPVLKEECKLERLKFCFDAIHVDSSINKWIFKSMKHVIHIDEKWFYLTKATERYYLHPSEEDPHRTCQNKKFITKVMFLCVVGRPMYNSDGSLIFDGKFGMFPFTEQVPAQRSSKNRAAGTLETKAIVSVTKQVIKACILNQVLPAIKAKWPLFESTDILIQQDNARPHISDNDLEFRAAASSDGFNIHLISQPPGSPDLNINDLGWFRALQSLQCKRSSYNIDQLVERVMLSFSELSHEKLNYVFLTLQNCMIEIMKVRGNNNYKIPHMQKASLVRQGRLPENLEVDAELARDCVQYIVETEAQEAAGDLF